MSDEEVNAAIAYTKDIIARYDRERELFQLPHTHWFEPSEFEGRTYLFCSFCGRQPHYRRAEEIDTRGRL